MPTLEQEPNEHLGAPDLGVDVHVHERVIGRVQGPDVPGRTGATLIAIVGVHGNERAGIAAARRVLKELQDHPDAALGTFVSVAGNLAALNHEDPTTRYIDTDMNRICPPSPEDDPGTQSVEHTQMRELMDAIGREHARCVASGSTLACVDLHTTSAPSDPIVAFEDSLVARTLVEQLRMPRYLGIEEELSGTIFDAITQRFSCISFLIEGGQHDDPRSIDVHEAALWVTLDALGIVDLKEHETERFDGNPFQFLSSMSGSDADAVFDLRHRAEIKDPDFMIEPGMRSGTPLRAGHTLIARESGREIIAPIHGSLFLPNMQTHKRIGDDAFFIVRRISVGWVNLSARLRRNPIMHQLIASLPGVHSMTNGDLLVDRDVAAALKRQVFHLLGYRLVRHEAGPSKSLLERVIRGLKGSLRGLTQRERPDPEDPRFWVVRRRVLDVRSERHNQQD